MKTRQVSAALLLCGLLSLLPGCGGDKALTPPDMYTMGEDSAPALVLGEEEGALTKQTQSGEDEPPQTTYTYTGMTSPGSVAEGYTALLMDEENSFVPVDESNEEIDLPDFTAAEGTVRLARDGVEEGTVFSIELSWSEEACTVSITAPEGQVDRRPPEGMTVTQALEYLYSLNPADLGLSGSSMRSYSIYALDGTVLVDKRPCMQFNVYTDNNDQNANEFLGTYFFPGTVGELYELDRETGQVYKLELS